MAKCPQSSQAAVPLGKAVSPMVCTGLRSAGRRCHACYEGPEWVQTPGARSGPQALACALRMLLTAGEQQRAAHQLET